MDDLRNSDPWHDVAVFAAWLCVVTGAGLVTILGVRLLMAWLITT